MVKRAIAWMTVLLVAGLVVSGAAAADTPTPYSALPVADGFVTDSNFDGSGDYAVDRANSVLVGFNAYEGPGEHRGVYEFEISSIPPGAVVATATLGLNFTGSRLNDIDPNLTLYAGAGNGRLDLTDYGLSNFVTTFQIGPSLPPFDDFENKLDVREAVQAAVDSRAGFSAFVVRPNPISRSVSGAWLFSSTEIGVFSPQFFPARLTVTFSPAAPDDIAPELVLPSDVTADATGPEGAAVVYSASATDDGHSVPVSCAPASGSTFAIGDTTVACSAVDAAGNQAAGSFVVRVAGSREQLEALVVGIVEATSLPAAAKAVLTARLAALLVTFDPDNARDRLIACAGLSALINRVHAYAALGIPPERAAEIVADARRIRNVLACG